MIADTEIMFDLPVIPEVSATAFTALWLIASVVAGATLWWSLEGIILHRDRKVSISAYINILAGLIVLLAASIIALATVYAANTPVFQ